MEEIRERVAEIIAKAMGVNGICDEAEEHAESIINIIIINRDEFFPKPTVRVNGNEHEIVWEKVEMIDMGLPHTKVLELSDLIADLDVIETYVSLNRTYAAHVALQGSLKWLIANNKGTLKIGMKL